MDQCKIELLAELNRVSKENQKLMVTIKLMSTNYHSLQRQLMKLQEDFKRASLKSMATTLKIGTEVEEDSINGECTQQVLDYNVDSSRALSDNSEDRSCKSSDMDDLQLKLPCKKRKINHVVEHNNNGNVSSSRNGGSPNKKAHEAGVPKPKKIISVNTKSEAIMVSDGCQWRKYGQKMTKNSRWPRAYYKCAVPSCTVKKQVQRCAEDPNMLTAIYEGEHNHLLSPVAMAAMNTTACNDELPFPASIATISSMGSSPTITLDLTNNLNSNLQGWLLDPRGYSQSSMINQVACSNADPNCNTAALATAIAASLIKLGTPLKGILSSRGSSCNAIL